MKIRFKQAATIFIICMISIVITGFMYIDSTNRSTNPKSDQRTDRTVEELHEFNLNQQR